MVCNHWLPSLMHSSSFLEMVTTLNTPNHTEFFCLALPISLCICKFFHQIITMQVFLVWVFAWIKSQQLTNHPYLNFLFVCVFVFCGGTVTGCVRGSCNLTLLIMNQFLTAFLLIHDWIFWYCLHQLISVGLKGLISYMSKSTSQKIVWTHVP